MSQTNTINLDDCWLWAGAVTVDDYAMVCGQYGHRLMYELYKGEIPSKLEIDHLCFVRRCVNPEHLEPVTHKENLRRSRAVRRCATHCPKMHPYSGDNLVINKKTNSKRCRECRRLNLARYQEQARLRKKGLYGEVG